MVKDGQARVIIRRETYEDLIDLEVTTSTDKSPK
jgi:hypothetical protein